MLKLFDNTFFKFLFGFLVILAISFCILYAVKKFDDGGASDTGVQTQSQPADQN